ncbi:hypothetical protein HDV02_003338 [Globomyces sp. JEL0801]|nr:hypothetical protein HDV02_003338 [Globomyces sp. JEL0801]
MNCHSKTIKGNLQIPYDSDEKEEIESTTTETQTLGIPVKMERRKSLMRLIGEGISASIQDSTIFKSGSFSNKDKLEKKIQASASVSSRLSDSADEKRSMSISSVLKIKGDEKDETEYLKDKQEYERNKNEMKVLVLGTSGSGKTTFINQIRRINGYTFTPVELQHAKSNQLYHILSILELVLFGCDDEVQQEYTQILSFVSQQPKPYLEIPSHVQKSIKRMWNDLKLKDHFNRLKIPNLD